MDDNIDDEVEVGGENRPSSLGETPGSGTSATTNATKRLEFPSLSLCTPKYPQLEGYQDNDGIIFRSDRRDSVASSAKRSTIKSPDLHTLSGHNIWPDRSGTKPLANSTNSNASNEIDMFIPDPRRFKGPLKKRLSSPRPPTRTEPQDGWTNPVGILLRQQTASSLPNDQGLAIAPLSRRTTSSSHFLPREWLPPQLRMHQSLGQHMIAEPLVETPQEVELLAKQNLTSTSSFQPSLAMSFTPALSLVTSQSYTKKPPVVTNRTADSAAFFRSATPHSILRRNEADQPLGPWCSVNAKNREEALSRLQATSTAKKTTSATQLLYSVHPFNVSSRSRIREPPRKPYFSPIPATAENQKGSTSSQKSSGFDATTKESQIKEVKSSKGRTSKPKSKKGKYRGRSGAVLTKSSLFKNVPVSDTPCKCGSTKCLKLYCECFHNAMFCNPLLCRCKDCMNTDEYNSVREPKGARVEAILGILSRRPRAFVNGGRKAVADREGCSCKKSGCLKKYCECVAGGRVCSAACSCVDCQN